jgi:hypothetical protein
MTSDQVEALAAAFWECAGYEEAFPRSLERAILLTKPVSITRLPRLCPRAIADWLRRRVMFPLAPADRWLNGCLICYRGTGFIFIEESLPAEDTRMIVAHEFGHFLAEYEWPRERVVRRLGPSVLPILDGDRAPAPAEWLGAALAGVPLGVHVHYLERAPGGTYPKETALVERTADRLALELIAPWQAVWAELRARGPLGNDPGRWPEVLQDRFGLPASWAVAYARRLRDRARRRRTFSDRWGL